MIARDGNSWQLILADLALILFLVATSAIRDDARAPEAGHPAQPDADVPAQAIYRPLEGAPAIDAWLIQQRPDPRMTLTVVATHHHDDASAAWQRAQQLAETARRAGIEVRVVTREGTDADLYASLGYDDIG